jgi:hypothetical protein
VVTLSSTGFVNNQIGGSTTPVTASTILGFAFGNTQFGGVLVNRVKVLYHTGNNMPNVYSDILTAFPSWDGTHLGKSVHHSLTVFYPVPKESFQNVFPNGVHTKYLQTFRGARVWDFRNYNQSATDESTWTWTDNAALIIMDYLRHRSGFNMPLKWLLPELPSWIDAANSCGELIPDKTGNMYKRYRLWGTYSYDERKADVLGRLLSGCNGRLWIGYNGGLALFVGVWKNPTITMNDDCIVSYKLSSGNEAPDTANTLTAVYLERSQGYTEIEAAPLTDDALIAKFGEKSADAKLFMVPSHNQCRRLMKQAFGKLDDNN